MLERTKLAGHRLQRRIQVLRPQSGLLGGASRSTIIAGVGVAFMLSVLAAAIGHPPRPVPAYGAEPFVGADGHREILTGSSSTQVRQTGHQPGDVPWDVRPLTVFLSAAEQAGSPYWIVETEDDLMGDSPHLLRLDSTGLRTHVAGWPEIRRFTPARPEVPVDPKPGQRITTIGEADGPDGGTPVAYTSVLEVSDAPDAGRGCLEFRRTDTIGAAAPVNSSRVRCPGRGVVRLELPTGRWQAVQTWPMHADPRPGVDLTDPQSGPLTGLSPHPIVVTEPGGSLIFPVAPPLSVGGGYVMANSTGNLIWITPADERYELGRWVDVGGSFTAMAQCGEVIVATTSRRAVMAHDGSSRWLWTADLADVAGTHPVRSGDDMLIATKDGRLTALGCRDGAVQWQVDGVASTVSPAVGPAGVLVAGDGSVRLLDPATGEERWQRTLPNQPRALGFFSTLAVAADSNQLLHGLAAGDGLPVWKIALTSRAVELHDLGEVVVARTWEDLVGIDELGRWRWREKIRADDSVSDGRHVLAADGRGIVVLDGGGRTVQRTTAELSPDRVPVDLVRTPTGVIVSDGVGTLIDWQAP